ncbi:hypothetical protein AZH51_16315 [Branchiibius sp. NY16-3462-2]|nr:hypothetical protein AZH51_16315 [Branchiibius sp. NY16-3462-2]
MAAAFSGDLAGMLGVLLGVLAACPLGVQILSECFDLRPEFCCAGILRGCPVMFPVTLDQGGVLCFHYGLGGGFESCCQE